MKIISDCDLSKLSYIGIGPVINKLYIAENRADLKSIAENSEIKMIGNLSNILFASNFYECSFVRLSGDFKTVRIIDKENFIVEVGGGCLINEVIHELSDAGIGGLEEFFGIPGTIGGMISLNAGAHGASISEKLIKTELMRKGETLRKNIDFGYRSSDIDDFILSATFSLQGSSHEKTKKRINELYDKRKKVQPLNKKSLGCVFKNPSPETPAWKLINNNGFAGKCEKGICVSKKHSNFIVNEQRGSAEDFIILSQEIIRTVYMNEKIKLEYEIEILI